MDGGLILVKPRVSFAKLAGAAQIWLGSSGSDTLDLDLTAAAGRDGSTRGSGSAAAQLTAPGTGGGWRLGGRLGAAHCASV